MATKDKSSKRAGPLNSSKLKQGGTATRQRGVASRTPKRRNGNLAIKPKDTQGPIGGNNKRIVSR